MLMIDLDFSKLVIFNYITEDQKQELLSHAKIVQAKKGHTFILFNEDVPGIFVLTQGTVGVYPGNETTSIATLNPVATFGEMSFIEKRKASATVRAEQDGVEVVFFNRKQVDAYLNSNPLVTLSMYRGIALTLSERLRATNSKVHGELQVLHELSKSLKQIDLKETLSSSAKSQLQIDTATFAETFVEAKEKLQNVLDNPGAIKTEYHNILLNMDKLEILHAKEVDMFKKKISHLAGLIQNVEKGLEEIESILVQK